MHCRSSSGKKQTLSLAVIVTLLSRSPSRSLNKIVKVDQIIPAHTATFEHDYTQMLEGVQNKKAMEAIDKFISDKIKSTSITIDPIFKECDFAREGWKEVAQNSGK